MAGAVHPSWRRAAHVGWSVASLLTFYESSKRGSFSRGALGLGAEGPVEIYTCERHKTHCPQHTYTEMEKWRPRERKQLAPGGPLAEPAVGSKASSLRLCPCTVTFVYIPLCQESRRSAGKLGSAALCEMLICQEG